MIRLFLKPICSLAHIGQGGKIWRVCRRRRCVRCRTYGAMFARYSDILRHRAAAFPLHTMDIQRQSGMGIWFHLAQAAGQPGQAGRRGCKAVLASRLRIPVQERPGKTKGFFADFSLLLQCRWLGVALAHLAAARPS